jgi:hypothetical protein
MEATMLDKRLSDKAISFELSLGNAGNSLDGQVVPAGGKQDESADDSTIVMTEDLGKKGGRMHIKLQRLGLRLDVPCD